MKARTVLSALGLALCLPTAAAREPAAPHADAAPVRSPLTWARVEARTRGETVLTSTAFRDGTAIPARHTADGRDLSPPLTWTPVAGARSYLLIVEDPASRPVSPFVHWLAWNIPGDATSLPAGVKAVPQPASPRGMRQGKTTDGRIGYAGPRSQDDATAHTYHFVLLALDRMLDVAPGADRDQVLAAARGHVIAKGQLTGRYGKPPVRSR